MQTNQAARDPALERLDAFVGEWTMEATFPVAPPTGIIGRTAFEWALNGQFLLQHSEAPHPDAPDVHAVIVAQIARVAFTSPERVRAAINNINDDGLPCARSWASQSPHCPSPGRLSYGSLLNLPRRQSDVASCVFTKYSAQVRPHCVGHLSLRG
jgi:hypothetical protein